MSREVVRARRTASAAAKSGWVQGIAARCCKVWLGARASLVPAAAVIPAPIAYIKIVAVKTLVVGYLLRGSGPSQ